MPLTGITVTAPVRFVIADIRQPDTADLRGHGTGTDQGASQIKDRHDNPGNRRGALPFFGAQVIEVEARNARPKTAGTATAETASIERPFAGLDPMPVRGQAREARPRSLVKLQHPPSGWQHLYMKRRTLWKAGFGGGWYQTRYFLWVAALFERLNNAALQSFALRMQEA